MNNVASQPTRNTMKLGDRALQIFALLNIFISFVQEHLKVEIREIHSINHFTFLKNTICISLININIKLSSNHDIIDN